MGWCWVKIRLNWCDFCFSYLVLLELYCVQLTRPCTLYTVQHSDSTLVRSCGLFYPLSSVSLACCKQSALTGTHNYFNFIIIT